MTVIVYTQPGCVACERTRRFLDLSGIAYQVRLIPTAGAIRDLIERFGYRQAPVVTITAADGTLLDHWSGLRPDRITTIPKE